MTTPMQTNPVDYSDLMVRFRRAFSHADREMLASVLDPSFEWHTHTLDPAEPTATGRILYGIDELLTNVAWRKQHWSNVRFDGLVERFSAGLVTQTFTISGVAQGEPFCVNAVDLYDITDDLLIAKKDTYWKYAR